MAQAANKMTALWVIRRLRQAGFEALLAGGCVRDMLLGIRSADYDVATNATPRQVKALFPHVLLVGAAFGVAMVIHHRRKVEVTTFRSDMDYADGRRPQGVRFSTPQEDALRRDFTINGMFYDPLERRVIDYVGGQQDLAAGLVRTIGRPHERFGEDYLRMLRAVRFAVRFSFRLDTATADAIRQHATNITKISGERIFDELGKMLSRSSAPAAMSLCCELGLARQILPELFATLDQWPAAMQRLELVAARRDLVLSLAAMLVDLDAGAINRIIRRWGGANELRESLEFLARHRHDWRVAPRMSLADFKRLLASKDFPRLRRLWSVDEKLITGRCVHSRRIAMRVKSIEPAAIAPPPLVTGEDLKQMGMTQGPQLGKILRTLYDEQLNEQLATRTDALARAAELLGQ